MRAGPLGPQDKQGSLARAQGRWGRKGGGALMLRAQPLGPYWGRGHLCCRHSRWGRIACFRSRPKPRMRAGPLGTQDTRGTPGCAHGPRGRKIRGVPQDARMAPGDAISEGFPECAQGGCGRKIGGVPGIRGGRLRPQHGRGRWNERREAQALT